MKTRTKDLNRAAFYVMWGGVLEDVSVRTLAPKQAKKKGFVDEWTLYMSNVPEWAKNMYDRGNTHGSIHEFVRSRRRLKKAIKKLVY